MKWKTMSTNFNRRAIEVILSSQIGFERIAMACSESFAQMLGFPPARIEDLKTVVAEAALNAMQHGNKGRSNARVKVIINFENNTIYVTVMDEGNGIKKFPPSPDIERIMDNLDPPVGYGLFLINQLADQVEFKRLTDGHHMVKIAIKLNT